MKTASASNRRLVGGLIILLALAAAWAIMNRQDRTREQEKHSPLYQNMPVLHACGVHLTGDDEHMLGHHKSVAIPFKRLDKRGREVVLEAVRKEHSARLDALKMAAADKKKSLDAVLEAVPLSLVGFHASAPGSAYVFVQGEHAPPIPVHIVPGTKHLRSVHIELHGHGEAEHGQWEVDQIREPDPAPPPPSGAE